ncbi:4-hydroxy-tetrahydrodipicolinate reductase [Deferribacter autotrophicus]|uniref:4-hydroxy-tetrahydrodipicolinate reductase n=1 Tax=Deferribacter autotrophicus TaxID=500465 RepID=A0A5A8F8T1_9BACT|nr:4-hydroxy-tetrahydrodipicolinate reductase [Deferribacter autotrophicus]KAA0258972.1 4-hydroxy-tetrahydrodipicolinate reductase [Deferribacter autotrophicus]
MSITAICMVGAAGKMGRRIIALGNDDSDIRVAGALEAKDSTFIGIDAGEVAGIGNIGMAITDDFDVATKDADVLIDFTFKTVTLKNLEMYEKVGKPVVIGTTGFENEEVERIKALSNKIPVLLAPNMSLGVNLTFKVLEMVAKAVGNIYDIEIIEAHHRLKKDAPSGTAMKMAEVVAKATNRDLEKDAVYCRRGLIGERKDNEIGIQTIRAGDIVGEHTVMFCGNGERIEITHKAHTRDTFAKGALAAAKWIKDKPAGFYSMFDVLNL